MSDTATLESATVTERLVLSEFAALDRDDRTPVQAPDLLERCRDRCADLDDVVAGRLTEADLVRCCRSLVDDGLVDERRPADTSPVGKGRPAYELAVGSDEVAALVRDDDRFDGVPTDGEAA